MMNPKSARSLRNLLPSINRHLSSRLTSSPFAIHHNQHQFHHFQSHHFTPHNPNSSSSSSSSAFDHHPVNLSLKMAPSFDFSFASRSQYSTTTTTTTAADEDLHRENPLKLPQSDSNGEVEPIDVWEEEDETEPEIGDGGDGGGVVLQNCPWGERVLSIAQDVLQQFGDDIEIFAFKTSPRGYIYVRLDRLGNEYGCPSMEDIQSYSHEYSKKLDEAGAAGDIPSDLALEVSSPGADRLLRIPDDLQRFKDMAMRVKYVEHDDPRSPVKEGIFFLESVEMESGSCVWRLADVKENRDPSSKGRPMTRKQKDWRLKLPYKMLEQGNVLLPGELAGKMYGKHFCDGSNTILSQRKKDSSSMRDLGRVAMCLSLQPLLCDPTGNYSISSCKHIRSERSNGQVFHSNNRPVCVPLCTNECRK